MSQEKRPNPRFGDEVDPTSIADNLELIVQRMQNGESRLLGVDVEHNAFHDEFSTVKITLELPSDPEVPILDMPIYKDREIARD